ncbi:MAG: flagellar type III secretion system pore protein FliP [Gemmatimonadaceae bacterium]
MTFGSIMGVLFTLGFVLALLGVALKLLRRFAPTSTTGARLRMEVVQRLALGPKQGIAVVRIGERLVAVSVGEGGIHQLFEMQESEVAQTATVTAPLRISTPAVSAPVAAMVAPKSNVDFRSALRGAMRNAGLLVVASAALALSSTRAVAQATTSAKAAATPTQTKTTKAGIATTAAQDAAAKAAKPDVAVAARPATPAATMKTDSPIAKLVPQMDLRVGNGDGLRLSGTVGIVVMMGLLTLLPTLLLMMTGFTRILIILNFLKQALGTQSAPPAQLVAALALLLTGFVMAPTLKELNDTALTPWMDGKIDQAQMMQIGQVPFRKFMLRQTRRSDLETFVRMSQGPRPATVNDVPIVTLTSAFVISELRTSFQIGFALFLPFIVIDVAVSSVLMSMGMFMLPPAMISLPFKLLLFVLVDGWSLIVQSLITSFK